ncbi:P-loop containing nucleoside triphosphate hydrolases superfamily protein [Perilla frutescens var. hirtella]|uniref:P-loop containing nucleoside triphosphate hydrolases superfamily protein n=1 Tax=Perilla frutescens var. hirtella TaxID=608512 RepID=A0AAD4IXQ1_PERFH|nr:P-loop containing nucleoside triphosphate hydrolases superfamily protein [Perilla frutescens var. hirtella]
MAAVWRLARSLSSYRTIASAKTLNPRPPLSPTPPLPLSPLLCIRSFEHQKSYGSECWRPEGLPKFFVHTALAGLLGFGTLDVAFADGNEAAAKTPAVPESVKSPSLPESAESPALPESAKSPALPESAKSPVLPECAKSPPPLESSPAASKPNLDEIARKEKARLEEWLKSKGGRTGSYPRFTVSVKGPKVTIKFQVPPSAEIPFLIANLVSRLGVKAEDSGAGTDMILRAWDSGVAWQLALSRPKTPKGASGEQGDAEVENVDNEELCILVFRPLISSVKAEIEFMKQGSFTFEELDALASILQIAGQPKSLGIGPRGNVAQVPAADKIISNLDGMGVKVYGLTPPNLEDSNSDISWDNIAGYDNQKREIEDTILLALKSPEVYDDIARGTRCKFETNRPRAVLFEGPPGTGKTSCARVIANQARVPLLYVPLEIVMSKYYGESERLLGKVFSLANELQDGAIIFLDEVDSLATARDSDIHEATRRLLSVLLRQIDGFEQEKKVVVIAATNRKQDLDPALLSRFDSMITFGLPDQQTREAIVSQYAKHLTKSELAELARATEDMSGRDIRDVCQQAERHWASKIIRGQTQKNEEQSSLPPLGEYVESAKKRRTAMLSVANQIRNPSPLSKNPQFDFI